MARSKRFLKYFAAVLTAILLIGSVPPIAFAEDYSAVVTEDTVQVYYDQNFTNRAGTLSKGAVVVVNAVYASVAQITYQGKSGYCDISALTTIADIARVATINASGVKVYEKPNTSSLSISVQKGIEVNVVAVSGNWALIEKNGNGAFMYAGYLTYAEEATPTPEATAQPTATPVIEEIPAVVTSETLSVYKSASTASTKLGTLKYGAEVTVMAYNGSWAYIEKDGNYGYCAIAGLTRADAAATPTPEPSATATPAPTATVNPDDYIPAVVSADSVAVYERASTSSKKLGTLKKGAEIDVVSYSGSWAYIEKNGNFGYCKLSALAKVEVPEDDPYHEKYPDIQFTATVIYDGAPVYAEPKSENASSALAVGTGVDVYAYNDAWAYIGIGDARGFIQIKYMSAAKYSQLSSGDSSSDVTKLQAALEEMGYFDGTPGGNFSTLTVSAVKRFQAAVNLTQTGTADVATLRVLYGGYAPASSMITTAITPATTGASVERLQTRLYYLGYLGKTSSIDGDYGTTTTNAIKLFQAQADLTQDGAASAATLKAMYHNGAPSLPSSKNPADYSAPSTGGGSSNGVTTMPAALASTTTSLSSGAGAAEKLEYVIYIAQSQLGKPYIYGTAGPSTFDCSGFTTYCFKKVNVSLGRSAYAQGYQANSGTKIESMSDLKRGDIVCFNTISDSDLVDHVGIYLGSGYFIHASSGTSNGKQVVVSSLSSGYYNRVYSWGRRPIQ